MTRRNLHNKKFGGDTLPIPANCSVPNRKIPTTVKGLVKSMSCHSCIHMLLVHALQTPYSSGISRGLLLCVMEQSIFQHVKT